jgi:DNA helicase-2/ATP-dependent DNA helicase PcrA
VSSVSVDLSGLNPDQREAVVHRGTPLIVVAGAGSGKTRVLTHRIAHLVASGVHPSRIMAITFTNKAANEMRERVEVLVGAGIRAMWVSTFHSACVRILRAEAEHVGYPRTFSIYDTDDARRLLGHVLRDAGLDPRRFPVRGVAARVSAWKNELLGPSDVRPESSYDEALVGVFREYQRRLASAGAMDFDDLLVNTVALFRTRPDVLARYQERFEHLLVDEYQDTNVAQNAIVLMLSAVHRNACIVGDTDQSIYRFRGADYTNFVRFEETFPDATTVVLDQNYRSTQTILDAANAVIDMNTGRQPKNLWTDAGSGNRIVAHLADDEREEADFVAERLESLHADGRPWGDMAVLYRTNAQSRVLDEALLEHRIPYVVIGGTKFYDRREVRDALAYLRLAANPADEVAIRRTINVPKRGIGDTSIEALDDATRARGCTLADVLRDPPPLGSKAARGLRDYVEVLDGCTARLVDGPGTVLRHALEASGYLQELLAEDTVESEGRRENLEELIGYASGYETVDDFLERVALVADTDELESSDRVSLMTMHAAKGLEYSVVAIVGMEDGVFPHSRSHADPSEMEEERRLAYVGITRARELLLLTHASRRSMYGTTQYNPPSSFLTAIPAALFEPDEFGDPPGFVARANRGAWFGGDAPTRRRDSAVRTAPTAVPQTDSNAGLRVGDDVRHPVFGDGIIIEIRGSGASAEAAVRFADAGTKHLALDWAPLTKIARS